MDSQSSDVYSSIELDLNNTTSSLNASRSASIAYSTSASSTFQKNKRPRKSAVWDHAASGEAIHNAQGKEIWHCKYCRKEYLLSGGTVNITQHLKKDHTIDIKSLRALTIGSYQQGIKDAFTKPDDHKRRRLDKSGADIALDASVLEKLYVRWITACGIAFRMTEIPEFRTYVLP
jgi:hypothetical protein